MLSGIKDTTLIDDTYNSSPRAAELALATLGALEVRPGARKFAALGDMLELGALSDEAHRRIGRAAAATGLELLVGVGPASRLSCEAAREAGMPAERVIHLDSSTDVGPFLAERLRPGDLVLIKGSQGVRMEKAVVALMAEPARAGEALVRQTKDWLR